MALPLTTHRAARAAAQPLHLVEPDGAPQEAATVHSLVGCMTGASNMVSEQLAHIDLPPKVSRFLRCLERATLAGQGFTERRVASSREPGARLCWPSGSSGRR